jgi:threonine dehydrogenase-like Zn-dependent dehydrogenase
VKKITVTGPGQWELGDVPAPVPAASEMLLAPKRIGICATDLEILNGSMVYLRDGRATLPLTPGHEWVAEVVDPGEWGDDFAPGDLVVGECSIGCGVCALCAAGAYHLCPDRAETGLIRRDGALTELMTFPAAATHRLPPGMAVDDAALIEPTAIAVQAVRRLRPRRGSRVLVVGAGTIGYLVAAVLTAVHSVSVAVTDPDTGKLERVAAVGGTEPEIGELFDGVVEASGARAGIATAVGRAAPGGRIVVVGLTGLAEVPTPLDRIVVDELEVLGSIGSPGVWTDTIGLVASGLVRPSALVTSTFPLARFADAVRAAESHAPGLGKLLIAP